MMIIQTTDACFAQDVLRATRPVLVDFWASWCPPCKMLEPLVDKLSDEYSETTSVVGLNIDRNPNTAQAYRLASVPTFIRFEGGREVIRKTGAQTERQIRMLLDSTHETCVAAPQFVTVVSGLPRSGTSMMMRMLEAGGMSTLTDGIRQADQDNPHGYYEFEPVKQLKLDVSWLELAEGKAVKMVCRLLTDLPMQWNYRVIFLRRKMNEVLASQRTMLTRMDRAADMPDHIMAALLEKELSLVNSWIRCRGNIRTLEVNYNELVVDPLPICARIDEFLGGGLDRDRMAAVIDPGLYRQRVA